MASSININQNNNVVTLQDNNGSLSITNNNTGTTINVTQPVTNVVTVATVGPQGPQGPIGPIPTSGSFSGSFTGSLFGTASNAITSSLALSAFTQYATDSSYRLVFANDQGPTPLYTSPFSARFNASTGHINATAFSGSFSGNLTGTASSAQNAVTASYSTTLGATLSQPSAGTLQLRNSANQTISSLGFLSAANAISSSFASTASFVQTAQTASYVLQAVSASFASTASSVNTLNQNCIISGSLLINTPNQTLGQFVGNTNGYSEFSVRNTNNGASASGDFAVYADTGTTLNNYIDMGINNSGLNPSYFYGGTDFGNALDAYVYNVGGNLRIGNATSQSPFSQSFYLFSNPTATPNITITGSQVAINKTESLNGTFDVNGNTVITGSLRGQVFTLSIASNTASVDMSTNNFFTLTLANGANTHILPTNINPGQTVNIRVTQGSAGTGTVSFPSFVDQASGSAYTGTAISNAIDIVTMITFDVSAVFLSSIRNMI